MEPSKLNETYIARQIVRKSQLKSANLLATREFEQIAGNNYIEFDPVEVKFNGFEQGKPQLLTVKIINKAPIPQRVHVLPPTEPGFSIKFQKKGAIAAGMSENIQICFNSDQYKYQYDVVKVNTETGNFVIPLYAYPSIPKLESIFPKIIDFGSVFVNESDSNFYPIVNPVPMDFPYEFSYVEESTAFIITPFQGIIQGNSTENIEITFVPSDKKTFTAEALLTIKQFDFQPIRIKIMGTGKQKKLMQATQRIKSSKLNPLKASETIVEAENTMNQGRDTVTNQKKTFLRSRTSYPKLLKKNNSMSFASTLNQGEKQQATIKKENEKQYLIRYSRVQELDKEKEVKFSQFLGDRALNEEELSFQKSIIEETMRAKIKSLEEICRNRHSFELKNDGEVEYETFVRREPTWDTNQNDQLKLRRQKLDTLVKAGSKVIEKYRLVKRLAKIRQFLKGCNTKEQTAKKVEEDYTKSLDVGKSGARKILGKLQFSASLLHPNSFPLQFKQEGESVKKVFIAQGRTEFDDNAPLIEIKPHETERMNYRNLVFPSDFVNVSKFIPPARASAEEEYCLKTPTLPSYACVKPSSVYELPIKIPTHQFIFNNNDVKRFKSYSPIDEKDPEFSLNSTLQHVQDEFQGWSKGEIEVLKAKFLRNTGYDFQGINLYIASDNDFGFMGQVGADLPKQINEKAIQKNDIIEEGDSDEEKLAEIDIQSSEEYLKKIEQNGKAKQRRQKSEFQNFEGKLIETINANLNKIKLQILGAPIGKISQFNKFVENNDNHLLI